MKTCLICNNSKPLDQFRNNRANKDGKVSYCKPCESAKQRERNKDPRVKELNRAAKYAARWKRTIGIAVTKTMVTAKLMSQNYACAICSDDLNEVPYHYDHDHDTLKLRDILCESCNRGLGHFADDPHLLRLAAAYIERHK